MMGRLLIITLMLGAAHAAFGHPADADPFFDIGFQYCDFFPGFTTKEKHPTHIQGIAKYLLQATVVD